MGNRVADARNQVKRWEKKFPPHVARLIIQDMHDYSHSPRNKEIFKAWLDSHPAPIQGTTLHIEQFREVDLERTVGDTFNIPLLPPPGPTVEGEADYVVVRKVLQSWPDEKQVMQEISEFEYTVNRPKPEPIPGITEQCPDDEDDGEWTYVRKSETGW